MRSLLGDEPRGVGALTEYRRPPLVVWPAGALVVAKGGQGVECLALVVVEDALSKRI
jgi:hypothetical protein